MSRQPGKRAHQEGPSDPRPPRHLIVGLGASAGGLDALERFFSQVPARTGLTFVVVQHLEPRHPSMLTELLARRTAVPVAEAAEGVRPEPDHVYVIAPGTVLALQDGRFRVTASNEPTSSAPIDTFLRSLAEDRGEAAVGIVFSGAGHDGAAGLRAIKERGGLTLAQDPETARHDSMPQTAIEAGLVDHVLAPEQMPPKLFEYSGYVAVAGRAAVLDAELPGSLRAICTLLQQHTGHDFSNYKDGTLLRRIRRRFQVLHVETVAGYVDLLGQDATEAQTLVKDLLIGVTQFFRDPEAFHALAQQVVPRIAQRQPADAPLRIWVPGCASGEEAYSMAILVREHLERLGVKRFIQIFATDLDADMLAEARQGRYPPSTAEHVSADRLARFFVREGQDYQAAKELREMCLFSQHSLIRDPPFSQLDLISCRNVLIYFSSDLQKKLIPLFHYALRPDGFLFLGPSEGAAGSPELFELVDKKYRIFRRKETVTRPFVEFPLAIRNPPRLSIFPTVPGQGQPAMHTPRERLAAAFERMVLEEYSWPCVVVDEHGNIVLVAGPVARYLQLPAGAPTQNLLESVRGGLRIELRAALQTASQTGRRVGRERISVDVEDQPRQLRLIVRPMPAMEKGASLFAVVLQELSPPTDAVRKAADEGTEFEGPAVLQLEHELRSTRAELRTTVEELESSNEELKSSNEELISTNEELQSANEEMQTSKEELQSLNEELETVNTELRQKVEEVGTANSDLANLFASTAVATIFLDRDLRVAKFTPAATELVHLIESDVGRPLGDFAPRFDGQNLVADAREVLRTLGPIERQVRAANGESWFILRVLPYRTVENVIAGVVVTFVDITELKRTEEALRQSEERFRLLVEGVKDYAILMLTPDGTVASWNVGAERLKGYREDEILGRSFARFYPEADVRAGKPTHQLDVAAATGRCEDEGWRVRKDGSRFWASVVITAIRDEAGRLRGFSKVARDFTERNRVERRLAYLASFPEQNPNPIVEADLAGQVRYANPAALQLFPDVCELGPAHPWLSGWDTLARLIREGHAETTTRAVTVGDRTYVQGFHFDAKEGVVRVYGLDTTKRQRAEEDLKRSREGLSRLAEASLRVMSKADLEGMFQAVSEAALALTGARLAACGHGSVNGQMVVGGSARRPGAPACPPGSMFQMEKGGVHLALDEGADTIRLTDEQLHAHATWWGLPEGHVPMRGLLGVRMAARNGKTNGVILVTDKEGGDFTAEDESLLQQLATVASLALQHVEARISLEEADRNKNQFLAMLSHELRNPLAPIRSSLYVLEHAAPGGDQAKRAQIVIDRQVGHMTRLVDDLLDVTRISRGKIQINLEPLDLGDVVLRAAEDHRPLFLQRGIALQVHVPETSLWISGDHTRIAQVIGNLLENAVKFTERGGEVRLSLEHQPALAQALIGVRDTGIGIGPEMLPRLFEPFSQAESTLDRTKGGLGLGLALVKGLVEMHGGSVSAASNGIGEGAEFAVRLPLESVGPRESARAVQSAGDGRARRILVIEDNVDAAESLKEALELHGHTVDLAFSGADGVEKAGAFKPDVVLCDIGLPGMNGFEVARAMRTEPALSEIVLVALSGYAAPEDVAKSREAGFDSHLAKPPSLEMLLALLASLA